MNVRCVALEDLSAAERAAWLALCTAAPRYRSPFFHPGYLETVARHQPGAEVAVCEEHDRRVGFFPFVRSASGIGRPVGGRLTDYHGPVLAPDVEWDALALVKACDLAACPFTHLPAGVPGFQSFEWAQSESPFLDLSDGFAVYCDGRRAAGSRLISQVQRKARKLERERGPVRFAWEEGSPHVLRQLLTWKAAQRRQTRTSNILGEEWARAIVEDLHGSAAADFGGVLSALYAGDRLVSAHFGLRTTTTLHWWFPAYDREMARYSPGLILLLELAGGCADRGITLLDLGKGHEAYKDGFSSEAVPLSEGCVDTRRFRAGLSRGAIALRERIRSSPLHTPMRRAKELYRSLRYR